MSLQASELSVGYRDRLVGSGFSLKLLPGEVLALLGPNGCGKTTLLKTLLGLLPPKAGGVTLAGRPLLSYAVTERARLLAYVPQSQTPTFGFSVFEMVLMGRTAHHGLLSRPTAHDRQVARDAIAHMGIAALMDQSVNLISGGERQLVLIARALAQQPKVVLLDEPTASLDFGNQGKVMQEIRRLAGQGLAVLFSTHDPNHALRYAHRAMLIRGGGVMAVGASQDVIALAGLQSLYQTGVREIRDSAGGGSAFLPGGSLG